MELNDIKLIMNKVKQDEFDIAKICKGICKDDKDLCEQIDKHSDYCLHLFIKLVIELEKEFKKE